MATSADAPPNTCWAWREGGWRCVRPNDGHDHPEGAATRPHEHHWVAPDNFSPVEYCGICSVPRQHEHHVHDKWRVTDCPECVEAATTFLSDEGAAPRAEGLDPLREAALRVILAQEAVRDAINGLGHPDEPHDSVLGDIRRDPTDEVQIIDTVDDCALCGGMQYGSEDTLNRAYGELRAALGLEVRPWEYPEDAARWLSSLSRASDEVKP